MPPREGSAAGGLTASALAGLLERLDPDVERAGAVYEELREALIAFFSWRGAATPEECADETLDRLARRLEESRDVRDVKGFARGIARLVLLEHWRRPDARRAELDERTFTVPPEPSDETLHICLDRCLSELPAEGSRLILDYYSADGGRARIARREGLARSLGLSEAALRNRAQRLRDRLERCITDCLDETAAGSETNTR